MNYVENKVLKLLVVRSISLSNSIFLRLASFCAVNLMNEGSFFLLLFGSGDKKGLSVSIKSLSSGIFLKVSCNSIDFLKVIMPLAEKYAFSVATYMLNKS